MEKHAILSPSASHRWLNCTAAPALEAKMPEETSKYAEEGTLAHAICEAKLHELVDGIRAEDYYKKETGHAWTEHELYQPEMEETSDYYRDVVAEKLNAMRKRTPDALLLIEVRLDFSKYIPEGFGTADAVVIGDGEIDVIDYKHGKGVKVDSYHNPQMMTYALGACERFGFEYRLGEVTMTIVQPRIDNTSTWELPYDALEAWGNEVLKPKAKEAFNGTLGCKTEVVVGEWCRFCKVKQQCKARAEAATGLLQNGDARLLSPQEISELLPKASVVKDWCSDIEEYALSLMLQGENIEGFKVVEGRSLRKISDPKTLYRVLIDSGYDEATILKPKELRSLSELEKLIGKKQFQECAADYIVKPKGKPTIALSSDKRKEFSTFDDDFSHIIN